MKELAIEIPEFNSYYRLYAEGPHTGKRYIRSRGVTRLVYPEDSVIFLYYSYPAYREAVVVRNSAEGGIELPSVLGPARPLFRAEASAAGRLKKAAEYLDENYGSAYGFSDGFYVRLHFLLQKGGPLSGRELDALAGSYLKS